MSEPPQLGHGGVAGAVDRLSRSATLVADIASVFAATSFDPADPGLAQVLSAGSHVVLRTDTLAVPMQREISWWMATCHTTGTRDLGLWADPDAPRLTPAGRAFVDEVLR